MDKFSMWNFNGRLTILPCHSYNTNWDIHFYLYELATISMLKAIWKENKLAYLSWYQEKVRTSSLIDCIRVMTVFSCSHCSFSSACLCFKRDNSASRRFSLSFDALSVSLVRESLSISSFRTARLISSRAVGFEVISIFNLAAASSTRSIAAIDMQN